MAKGTELSNRLRAGMVVLGIILLAMTADILWMGRDVLFTIVFAVAMVVAFNEFCNLCEAWGIRTFRVLGSIACLGMLALHWMSLPNVLPRGQELSPGVRDAGMVVLLFGVFLRQAFIKDAKDALPAVGMTLLGVLYICFLPSFLIRIRHLGGADWLVTGHNLMVAVVFISKISDVGAYFFGKRFGRIKLIPRISPGKSIEGAVFGLVCSVGMAFGFRALDVLPWNAWETLAFGLLIGTTGQCGDLLESIFKRSGQHKDSGATLPGYGGVLDVVDSLVASAPAAYLFLRVVGGLRMGTG